MKANAGFTLIELMITLAVAGVVLTVGIPSFRVLIQNNSTASDINRLVNALNFARGEAIGRGQDVCVFTTGENWQAAWQLVLDSNRNSVCDTEEGDEVIQFVEAPTTVTIATDGVFDGNGGIHFDASGALVQTGIGAQEPPTLTLLPEYCRGINRQREITISLSGHVGIDELACPE